MTKRLLPLFLVVTACFHGGQTTPVSPSQPVQAPAPVQEAAPDPTLSPHAQAKASVQHRLGSLSPQGGTITSVLPSSGGGLTGGGTAGAVTLGIASAGCSATDTLVWSGTSWGCSASGAVLGSGTIGQVAVWNGTTSVTGYTGLTTDSSGNVTNHSLTTSTLTDNGSATFAGPTALNGTTTWQEAVGTWINPTLSGSVNDWAPTGLATASQIIVAPSSNSTITGISGGVDGRTLTIYNDGAGAVTLVHNSGSSLAANRLNNTFGSINLSANLGCAATYTYSVAAGNFWLLTNFTCSNYSAAMTFSGGITGPLNVNGALTADSSNRVFDTTGTGLARDGTNANQVDLNINGGTTQTCSTGSAVTSLSGTGITSCSAVSGITGSGTSGQITVWNGTTALTGYTGLTSDSSGNVTANSLTSSSYTSVGELDGTVQTTSACTGVLADISLNANTTVLRINATSSGCDPVGIVAPTRSRFLWVVNSGTAALNFYPDNTNETTVANRIETPDSVTWQLGPMSTSSAIGNNSALLYYDTGLSRWIMMTIPFANTFPGAFTVGGIFTADNAANFCTGCVHSSTIGPSNILLEAGNTASAISIGDLNTGGVTIGASGNPTTVGGTLNVNGTTAAHGASTFLTVDNAGSVRIAAQDTTDSVESFLYAYSGGGLVGTDTNGSPFYIQGGGTNSIEVNAFTTTICVACTNTSVISPASTSLEAGNAAGTISIGNLNTGGITLGQSTNATTVAGSLMMSGAGTAGHVHSTGTGPSVSSCGTGATITGGDFVFRLHVGTSASNSCTLTWGGAYTTNAPVCSVDPEGGAVIPNWTPTTSGGTLNGTLTSGGNYALICGAPN